MPDERRDVITDAERIDAVCRTVAATTDGIVVHDATPDEKQMDRIIAALDAVAHPLADAPPEAVPGLDRSYDHAFDDGYARCRKDMKAEGAAPAPSVPAMPEAAEWHVEGIAEGYAALEQHVARRAPKTDALIAAVRTESAEDDSP